MYEALSYSGQSEVADVYRAVLSLKSKRLHKLSVHYLDRPGRMLALSKVQEQWLQRRISNFEYLMR